MSNFYDLYVALCAESGESLTGAAKEIGLSNATPNGWKKGKVPSDVTLKKIANHFNVPLEYLKNGTAPELPDKPGTGVKIPVYGRVAAGIPIEMISDIIDIEEITEDMARNGEYFGLQIHGDSMEPRMCDGDIIIVRQQEDADTGSIVVATVNGTDATCKRLKKYEDGIALISLNPTYEPMYFTNKEVEEKPVRILGKVVELRGKF